MGCHAKALERLASAIRRDRANADHYLDEWIDCTTRATEWDADHWGFAPNWMQAERSEMDKRATRSPYVARGSDTLRK